MLVPRPPAASAPYSHQGIAVAPYPAREAVGQAAQMETLGRLFREYPGPIYHQHSWTPDLGLEHLALARRFGLRTVLTVHVPSSICLRGTMMRFGQTPCSGDVGREPCAGCWAQGRGAPRALAEAVERLPLQGLAPLAHGRLKSALSARALVAARRDELAQTFATADRVVAVCRWLHQALAANGAPPEKLVLSRQGVGSPFGSTPPAYRRAAQTPYRLLYLGRWDEVKGIDTVVEALRAEPDLALTLSLHAISGGEAEAGYEARVRAMAAGDARIVFHAPVGREALPEVMAGHDALVIPSRWLETGPLVALEAQAAGLYVIGSAIGGVAELIDHPLKGELVAADSVKDWRATLRRFAETGPPKAVSPDSVRTMDDVAGEMDRLYSELAAA